MDGVTILQTLEVTQYTSGVNCLVFLLVAMIFVFFTFAGAILFESASCNEIGWGSVVAIVSFILAAIIFIFAAKYLYNHNEAIDVTQYQVIIDDSASATEFLDRYTIIEQQGSTYIVQEKTE
jgi:uncharacterized membrane protein